MIERIMADALAREKAAAGYAIAAQDVGSIAYGGVCRVAIRGCGVEVQTLDHDVHWISSHTVIALDPAGSPHKASVLLRDLIADPRAGRFVRCLSRTAERAAAAIRARDVASLGDAVNRSRHLFNEWASGRYVTPEVAHIAGLLQKEFGRSVYGYKPPGAGAASVLMAMTDDVGGVIAFLNSVGWYAWAARVTRGLDCQPCAGHKLIRMTAGHRIDFVGAADLGIALPVEEAGVCVSCCVEPRNALTFEA